MMSCRLRNCRNRKKKMSGKLKVVLREESVAKNAIDSRKYVSFWGFAPDPAGGAYSAPPIPLAAALFWLLTIEVERLGALIHCPAPGR